MYRMPCLYSLCLSLSLPASWLSSPKVFLIAVGVIHNYSAPRLNCPIYNVLVYSLSLSSFSKGLMLIFTLNKLNLSFSLSLPPHTHRSNGSILHNLIVASQHPGVGYTLNNVTSHVLYKIIHYFMENPINGNTVLKYPVPDAEVRKRKSLSIHFKLKYYGRNSLHGSRDMM